MQPYTPATIALLTAAAAASAGTPADVTLELIATEDISSLTTAGAPVFIGGSPTGIAFDGASLYLAGHNTSSGQQTVTIARIGDFLAGSGAWTIDAVGAATRPADADRYFSGLDWNPQFGLLSAYSAANGGSGQFRTYNDDGMGGFTLTGSSSGGRGRAAPSWDTGPNGGGYLLSSGNGPLAAVLDNDSNSPSGYGFATIGQAGPLGLDPSRSNLPGRAAAFKIPPGGILDYPRLIPSNGNVQDTLWHALDIEGAWVAARASNDLVLAQRGDTNFNVGEPIRVDGAGTPTLPGTDVAVLDQLACGDVYIVWNSRPDAACSGTFNDALRVTAADGSDATFEIVDDEENPVTLPAGDCWYGFDWDPASQLLFVSDHANSLVHVLAVSCAGMCNEADLAEPFGILDLADITTFITAFSNQDPAADIAEPEGVFDLADITGFVTTFSGGCP